MILPMSLSLPWKSATDRSAKLTILSSHLKDSSMDERSHPLYDEYNDIEQGEMVHAKSNGSKSDYRSRLCRKYCVNGKQEPGLQGGSEK